MNFLIAKWQPHPAEGTILARTGLWTRLQTLWDARLLGDPEIKDARHSLLKFKVHKARSMAPPSTLFGIILMFIAE